MNFAREGFVFIGIVAALSAVAFVAAVTRRSWGLWLLAFALLGLTLCVAYLFRDPERVGAPDARVVVAPADGRVTAVSEVDEPTFLRGRAMRVSIDMNVFNVPVNRYPVAGTVRYVHRSPGRSAGPALPGAARESEQASVGIDAGHYRILIRQIAGAFARRIHTYGREGERVEQGERMGVIRFGSRVDLFVPTTAHVRVAAGQRTVGGVTIVSDLPAAPSARQPAAAAVAAHR